MTANTTQISGLPAAPTPVKTHNKPVTGRRRFLSLLLTGVAVAVAVFSSAGSASAQTTYLNGSESSVYAGGDNSSHELHISVSALQMSSHPDGQYVRYQVWVRDVTYATPGAWTPQPLRGPYLIDGRSTYSNCDVMSCEQFANNTAVPLENLVLQGVAGRHYQVTVYFGYWTGSSYSTAWSSPTTYGNTIWNRGYSSTLTNSFALT